MKRPAANGPPRNPGASGARVSGRILLWALFAGMLLGAPACEETPTTPERGPVPPVAAAPEPAPPDCGDLLEVEFLGRNTAAGTAMGKVTLQALDPWGATLDFVRPYAVLVPEGGANLDVPGLSPTVGVFVSDLRFEPEEGWFQQTATLEWVADLEVRATASGCDPAAVSCDSSGCLTQG